MTHSSPQNAARSTSDSRVAQARPSVALQADETSSSGSSSDDERMSSSSDSEAGHNLDNESRISQQGQSSILLPFATKPQMVQDMHSSSNLSERLSQFLPALKAANSKLSDDVAKGKASEHNLEVRDGDEAEPHVDMNLALGVLKADDDGEGAGGSDAQSTNDSRDDASADRGDEEMQELHDSAESKSKPDTLDTLMRRKKRPKPSIGEV